MTRVIWGATGSRYFETGIDRAVLFPPTGSGVPWNGLVSLTEAPDGGQVESYYQDGVKYVSSVISEEYRATLDAFTYPDQFEVCDGTAESGNGLFVTHQPRKPFSLCYRTLVGNDVAGTDHAYKLHFLYNALAEPTTRNNRTLGESVDPNLMSWAISATPPAISGFKPTAHLIVDTRQASASKISQVENIAYGTSSTAPRMPTPSELKSLFV